MLSHALWSRLFGEDARIEERVVRLQDVPHTVIGVLPAGFHFAPGGDADVFLPVRPNEQQADVTALLAAGAGLAAVAAIASAAPAFKATHLDPSRALRVE